MKVLYVGEIAEGRTSYHRFQAMRRLGLTAVPLSIYTPNPPIYSRAFGRALRLVGVRPDTAGLIPKIRLFLRQQQWDMVWLDKVLTLSGKEVARLAALQARCKWVFYTPDDMKNPINQSRQFSSLLPTLTCLFTTKEHQVDELTELGTRKVFFVPEGYDDLTHRPVDLTHEDRRRYGASVSFIGGYEAERCRSLEFLHQNGVSLRIQGTGWRRGLSRWSKLQPHDGDLVGLEYAKAIQAAQINLCFLRKANRDRQTTRSFEIPACGGFMLAERTAAHLRLFVEGREAEFFASNEELLEKVRYYLDHPAECRRVAVAGMERCRASGYSNVDRMERMLRLVNDMS